MEKDARGERERERKKPHKTIGGREFTEYCSLRDANRGF